MRKNEIVSLHNFLLFYNIVILSAHKVLFCDNNFSIGMILIDFNPINAGTC